MFVKPDSSGHICAASLEPTAEMNEPIPAGSPELLRFINAACENQALPDLDALKESDLAMSRVLEDLINLLIDKNLIQFTELPAMAQQKLMARQSMRNHNRLELLSDDDMQVPLFR